VHLSDGLQQLRKCLRAAGAGGSLRLRYIYDEAVSSFKDLVFSQPQLLEAYESTDAHGATVRRYALVASGSDSPAGGAAPQEGPEAASSSSSQAGGAEGREAPVATGGSGGQTGGGAAREAPGARAPAARGTGTAERPAAARPPVARPPAQRRPRHTAGAQSGQGQLSALAGEAAWLRQRFGAAVQLSGAADPAREGFKFALALRPNDPDWEAGRELQLVGAAAPGYPAPRSFSLAPGPGLPDKACGPTQLPALSCCNVPCLYTQSV